MTLCPIMVQVNTEPTISRSIKLIVRPGEAQEGMRRREKVSGDYLKHSQIGLPARILTKEYGSNYFYLNHSRLDFLQGFLQRNV